MKENLIGAIYKKAMGYDREETQTQAENYAGKKKQKIVKTTKHYPPDLNSAKYLLLINFGRDYSDKKEELELMEKRLESKDEEFFKMD